MVVPDPPLEIGASQPLIGLDDQTGGDWGDDSGGSGGILGYVGNSLKQAVLGNYTPVPKGMVSGRLLRSQSALSRSPERSQLAAMRFKTLRIGNGRWDTLCGRAETSLASFRLSEGSSRAAEQRWEGPNSLRGPPPRPGLDRFSVAASVA